MPRNAATSLLLLSLAVLAGCAQIEPSPRADRSGDYEAPPVVQPIEVAMADPQPQNEGSIFVASSPTWSPWHDDKAHAVGDIITVRISINRTAEESASTGLSRESSLNAGIEALFGLEEDLPGIDSDSPLNGTSPASLVKSTATNEFNGDGETRRSGTIVADISAVVTHVYPNGNLHIHGTQATTVNNEDSLLTVEGLVRPSDISFSNIVDSDRIANARILVTGKGVVSDKQRPGFLMRLFDWAWPF